MADDITLPGQRPVPAYLVQPIQPAKAAILVIHEIWGLVPHTRTIADRLAAEGYIALAPDLLYDTAISRQATAELQADLFDPDSVRQARARAVLAKLMAPLADASLGQRFATDLSAAFDYLYGLPASRRSVGVVGFCFGGTQAFSLAVRESRLRAAVAFYGQNDYSVEELAQINCPVLALYGEQDDRIVGSLPELIERMRRAGVDFRHHVYPECRHAFFNDSNRFTYHRPAAEDAWQRTKAFLTETLLPAE